jgi:predicted protein tyrosine phosphatase
MHTMCFCSNLHQVRSVKLNNQILMRYCIRLSVPDGGYYRNTSCTFDWAYLMKVTTETHRVHLTERTWWRLLQKHIVYIWLSVPDGGYYRNTSCTFDWAYLMEVTTETHRVHLTERTWWRLLQKYIVYIVFICLLIIFFYTNRI